MAAAAAGTPTRARQESFADRALEWAVVAWPAISFLLLVSAATIAFIGYGPQQALQTLLGVLVPVRPTAWHAAAVWVAIVTSVTCGLPMVLVLFPVPALMFGFKVGFAILFFALMSAATISFIIGRTVLQDPVRALLERGDCRRAARWLRTLEGDEDSLKLLIVYRFLLIPMCLRNYGPSLLRLPLRTLVLSATPHSAWSAAIFSTAGSSLKGTAELLRDGHSLPTGHPRGLEMLGLCVACLSLLMFAGLAYRVYARREAEEACEIRAHTQGAAEHNVATCDPFLLDGTSCPGSARSYGAALKAENSASIP